jgi:inorganic pyrophosphatase/exopolyphosphatase
MYMLEDVFLVLTWIISCNSQLELYLRGKKIVEKDRKRDSESRQQQRQQHAMENLCI